MTPHALSKTDNDQKYLLTFQQTHTRMVFTADALRGRVHGDSVRARGNSHCGPRAGRRRGRRRRSRSANRQ